MKFVDELAEKDLHGKRVFLRAGLNVPVEDGKVVDDFRIMRALPTIKYLSDAGAKVIIGGHIGRNGETLGPVAEELKKHVSYTFVSDITGTEAKKNVANMNPGAVLLLENLRTDEREETNDDGFAKELALLADIYVNDAFSVSHREHASIVGLPKHLPAYGGLLMRDETEHLSLALKPSSPSLAILGGAKFETKEPLIRKLLDVYDHVFIGGALMNDFWKVQGFEVGRSRTSNSKVPGDVLYDEKIIIPRDAVVENSAGESHEVEPPYMTPDDKVVDIGPESFMTLGEHIKTASFILWNGPTGLYEDGYDEYSRAIAETIARTGAQSIIGGGDTLAVLDESAEKQFSFVSTGGGAMLQFLLNGTLPGIEALNIYDN